MADIGRNVHGYYSHWQNIPQLPKNKVEGERREQWTNPVEFVLSCLGYAVGLGNIWRFPYVFYKSGGGAFFIPYIIMLVFVGIPAFFMEMALGQYSGCGPVHIWAAAPLFQGIGLGMLFITALLSIFYTMLIAYSLYFLIASFTKHLPWDSCNHDYNTEFCYSMNEADACQDGVWYNKICYNETYYSGWDPNTVAVERERINNLTLGRVSSSEEYLNFGVLEMSDGIEESGGIKWELAVALLVAWVLCFLCIMKGIKSSGKAVYVTVILPYVILLILLIRGATLPGAYEGIKFYIVPKWEKLKEPSVWADAAGQIFFSLSVGGGGLMTFASYNKFHNNIYRDVLIVSIGNSLTSLFAGFVIFSVLGYMAHELGKDVGDVVAEGSTLAFVAYPQVVTMIPISQLWAVLFFIMLITLGLDSLFAGVEAVVTAVVDSFPKLRKRKIFVTMAICIVFFFLGLSMCTRAGAYWLSLIAYYATGWSLIVIGLAEVLVFGWVYGASNIMDNVKEMVGFKLYPHWWVIWKFITPGLLIAVIIFNLVYYEELTMGDYVFPVWAQVVGWLMTLTSIMLIIVVGMYRVCKSGCTGQTHSCMDGIRKLVKPSAKWQPSYRIDCRNPSTNIDNGGATHPPHFSNIAPTASHTYPHHMGTPASQHSNASTPTGHVSVVQVNPNMWTAQNSAGYAPWSQSTSASYAPYTQSMGASYAPQYGNRGHPNPAYEPRPY